MFTFLELATDKTLPEEAKGPISMASRVMPGRHARFYAGRAFWNRSAVPPSS